MFITFKMSLPVSFWSFYSKKLFMISSYSASTSTVISTSHPKSQKLYNFSILKLLNVNLKNISLQDRFKLLENFNLQPFKARVSSRVSIFIYNVKRGDVHQSFKHKLKSNNCPYNLRQTRRQFVAPASRTMFGSRRLFVFYCLAMNKIFLDALKLDLNPFVQSLK